MQPPRHVSPRCLEPFTIFRVPTAIVKLHTTVAQASVIVSPTSRTTTAILSTGQRKLQRARKSTSRSKRQASSNQNRIIIVRELSSFMGTPFSFVHFVLSCSTCKSPPPDNFSPVECQFLVAERSFFLFVCGFGLCGDSPGMSLSRLLLIIEVENAPRKPCHKTTSKRDTM